MPSCKRRTEWAVEKSKRTRLKLLHFAGDEFLCLLLASADILKYPQCQLLPTVFVPK